MAPHYLFGYNDALDVVGCRRFHYHFKKEYIGGE